MCCSEEASTCVELRDLPPRHTLSANKGFKNYVIAQLSSYLVLPSVKFLFPHSTFIKSFLTASMLTYDV